MKSTANPQQTRFFSIQERRHHDLTQIFNGVNFAGENSPKNDEQTFRLGELFLPQDALFGEVPAQGRKGAVFPGKMCLESLTYRLMKTHWFPLFLGGGYVRGGTFVYDAQPRSFHRDMTRQHVPGCVESDQ